MRGFEWKDILKSEKSVYDIIPNSENRQFSNNTGIINKMLALYCIILCHRQDYHSIERGLLFLIIRVVSVWRYFWVG